ncbi:MAG: hypothetical protein JXA33_21440 [Anaerolineae bacterium]|nr:hypothetical protein [Anaerolineae bacterium]
MKRILIALILGVMFIALNALLINFASTQALNGTDAADSAAIMLTPVMKPDAFMFPTPTPGGPPAAPGWQATSSYMIGKIVVSIVFPESNGGIDPSTENWSMERLTQAQSQVIAGINWWSERDPNAQLTFIFTSPLTVETSYEPIIHPVFPEENLWIGDVMQSLGYPPPSSDYGYAIAVRNYVNALREQYQADWGTVVFVVDDENDPDHAFADGLFGYAYFNGPYLVLTHNLNGWGTEHMDAIAAHELGHVFWAQDQYDFGNASQLCEDRSGYLFAENQNLNRADISCLINEPSIMRGDVDLAYATNSVDPYARMQVGWNDTDGDGILDPIDTTPMVTITNFPTMPVLSRVVVYTGVAQDISFPSNSPMILNATINNIATVQQRVDSGTWHTTFPSDGVFNSATEQFESRVLLPNGTYTIELRAVNSQNNISNIITTTVTVSSTAPLYTICLPLILRQNTN